MGFNVNQPRDKTGKWIDTGLIKAYENLGEKDIKYYNKSGSGNENKFDGLNEDEIEIAKSFESLNDNREINEISMKMNQGIRHADIKKEYGGKKFKQYLHVTNYMDSQPPHTGEIIRKIRDDHDIFGKYKIGREMTVDRLTSFGEADNEFKIKGHDLTIHIENNTRGKSVKNLMPFKEEKEVLIDSGKYRVSNKTSDYDGNHIYLQEI